MPLRQTEEKRLRSSFWLCWSRDLTWRGDLTQRLKLGAKLEKKLENEGRDSYQFEDLKQPEVLSHCFRKTPRY